MNFLKLLRATLSNCNYQTENRLCGVKIWLSGAIPEKQHWSHPLVDRDILEFVSVFSAMVFENGGSIIHGSHPSLTPILKRQAQRFASKSDQLQLFISSHWNTDPQEHRNSRFNLNVVTAEYKDGVFERDISLLKLRNEMVKTINVAVFIGGKLHLETDIKPGVPEEMKLASTFNIPSFVLGGVDGAAQEFADIDYLTSINDISKPDVVIKISKEENIYTLPSQIIGDLILNREKIQKRKNHG